LKRKDESKLRKHRHAKVKYAVDEEWSYSLQITDGTEKMLHELR